MWNRILGIKILYNEECKKSLNRGSLSVPGTKRKFACCLGRKGIPKGKDVTDLRTLFR